MRPGLLAFAAGVAMLQTQPELPPALPWAVAGLLLGGLAGRCRGATRCALLALAAALLGFAWAAWRAEIRLADALDPALEGVDVDAVGIVAGLPQEFAGGDRFEFVVETAAAGIPRRLLLSRYGQALPALRPAERWRFVLRLKRPHGGANPGGFDYAAWLLERGLRATGQVRPGPAERLAELAGGPGERIERLRDELRRAFRQRLPEEAYPWAGVLLALAIGDQNAVEGELWNVFNRTGTTHLMSISGLHVTLVAGLCGGALAALWRRRPGLARRWPAQRVGVLGAALAAAAYTLLAGFAVPAQRTLYMLLVAAVAQFAGRLPGPGRTLQLALAAVLLLDPWAVLAPGFWLSFGAVGALLLAGAPAVGELPGWRGRLRAWGLAQWVATLASLPVLLLVFQQFSLVSPLANALAIPWISLLVTPLALFAVAVPWAPPGWLAHALLDVLMRFLLWCAGWPLWQAPAPAAWAVAGAALGVGLLLLPRGLPGRWLGGFLLVPLLAWPPPRPPSGVAWLNVLDVGQGLASVVRTARHTLVYDPGPRYGPGSDAGQRVVVPYLRWAGIDRVDRLIVSHRDSDHAGGSASLRAALPVAEVLASFAEPGARPCAAGERWTWDGVEFALLHPLPGAADARSNHLSCVLRIAAGGRRALLTADIEASDEAALLARDPAGLAADVLLVPHHGSSGASTPEFVAATGAAEAIVAAGYRNRFGHPQPAVVDRYAAAGCRLWRTDRDGAISVELGPDGVAIGAWRAERRRYWAGR